MLRPPEPDHREEGGSSRRRRVGPLAILGVIALLLWITIGALGYVSAVGWDATIDRIETLLSAVAK